MDNAALKATTIYLPPDMHKALRLEAIEQGISMTELARVVIEAFLKKAGRQIKRHSAPKVGRPVKGRAK